MDNIELRLAKLEVKVHELEKSPMKDKKSTFKVPDNIEQSLYNKLVEVRKKLVKETGNNSLNIVFSGTKFVRIIQEAQEKY